MSIVKDYLIRCDNCGNYDYTSISAKEARETAKRMGWVRRNRKDYCPYCIPAKAVRPRKVKEGGK